MSIKEKYEITDEKFYNCIADLINNKVVLQMENYIQHGRTNCLNHCLNVSYKSYKIARKLNLDYKAVARAALLHDLFLYDWHTAPKIKNILKKHGYIHPQLALQNAQKNFKLTSKEQDIILKHMWPLTIRKIPKYKESFLVCFIDKYVSLNETIFRKKAFQ